MKGFGFLYLLLLLIGAAAAFLYLTTGFNPGIKADQIWIVEKRNKLKELQVVDPSNYFEGVHMEDYRPIDPVPSSKASIRPGPIQHDKPVMPYVPKPKPIASPPPGNH